MGLIDDFFLPPRRGYTGKAEGEGKLIPPKGGSGTAPPKPSCYVFTSHEASLDVSANGCTLRGKALFYPGSSDGTVHFSVMGMSVKGGTDPRSVAIVALRAVLEQLEKGNA